MTTRKDLGGGFGDKYRLLHTVATDARASRASVAVMSVILWRFNSEYGCCWPAIESIAEDADLDSRTVQRALECLEEWGYLHTVRRRGKLNRYVPHFQTARSSLQSNGRSAGGDSQKGRHFRHGVTAGSSERDGHFAASPTVNSPPKYLNESIPKREKEKEPSSFGGNQEIGIGGRPSDTQPAKPTHRAWSPEERAAKLVEINESRKQLWGIPAEESEATLAKIEADYLAAVAAECREPSKATMALIRPDEYGEAA